MYDDGSRVMVEHEQHLLTFGCHPRTCGVGGGPKHFAGPWTRWNGWKGVGVPGHLMPILSQSGSPSRTIPEPARPIPMAVEYWPFAVFLGGSVWHNDMAYLHVVLHGAAAIMDGVWNLRLYGADVPIPDIGKCLWGEPFRVIKKVGL